MFKYFIFCHFIALISISVVFSEENIEEEEEINKVESLCERPFINAADRLVNNSVRLYRGRYYWTLDGLPAESGTLDGPFELPFKKMGSIFRNNTVVTLLGGTDRGKTVKTEGNNYWLWDDMGNMKTEIDGLSHNRFPRGGFEAAIHDGNMDDPTLIGFKGIKVYYLSTRYKVWTIDNRPSGYFGGKYNESFPTDLSAAFTLEAKNPRDGYIAYLFKRDKYCKRPKVLKSGKDCDQWLPNRQLFGCDEQTKGRNSDQNQSDAAGKEESVPNTVPNSAQTVNTKPENIGNSLAPPSGSPPKANPDPQTPPTNKEGSDTTDTIKPIDQSPKIQENSVISTTPKNGVSLPLNVSFTLTFVLTFIQIIFL